MRAEPPAWPARPLLPPEREARETSRRPRGPPRRAPPRRRSKWFSSEDSPRRLVDVGKIAHEHVWALRLEARVRRGTGRHGDGTNPDGASARHVVDRVPHDDDRLALEVP